MASAEIEAGLSLERKKRKIAGSVDAIPAISLAPFLSGSESDKKAVAEQWDKACREMGFVKVREPVRPRRSCAQRRVP